MNQERTPAFREIDSRDLSPRDAYFLLIGSIVPRPIAWVSTIDSRGRTNAAPFSFFNGVCANPPVIAVSVGRRRGELKDTTRNIDETREFVVNVVPEELAVKMVGTSADYSEGESEFEKLNLTALPSKSVKPPRIGESPIQMECRCQKIIEVGNDPVSLILGEVLRFHVRKDLLDDAGGIDINRLRPVGRLGGSYYARVRDVFEIDRPPKVS